MAGQGWAMEGPRRGDLGQDRTCVPDSTRQRDGSGRV